MSRYRPPAAPKSPYVTRAGWRRCRPNRRHCGKSDAKSSSISPAAAAEGDRSENAEYIYRKKQLREIDRRIRYLQKRLPALKVVETQPEGTEQVFFGAWITLENEAGEE